MAIRPGVVVTSLFACLIGFGTIILMLPWSTTGPHAASWDEALFTSTSAVTVTGLGVLDTGTDFTLFGQITILLLIQVGGLGLATLASVLLLVVSRRLGISSRLVARAETPWVSVGEAGRVLRFIVVFSLIVEMLTATMLAVLFHFEEGLPAGSAAWQGVFLSVSSFNNAGFSLFSDSLEGVNNSPGILLVLMVAIVVGGIGFPIYIQLRGVWLRPKRWSTHARLTLGMTSVLLVLGFVTITAFEWTNPATLGHESASDTLWNGMFASVTARTAGFNTFDYGGATQETLLVTSVLMFIGGGSASTAGGIKVTTFVLLLLIVRAEAAGHRDVVARHRRVSNSTLRGAVALVVSYSFLAVIATLMLLAVGEEDLREAMFEAISAVSTTGLSTGITSSFNDEGLLVLTVLMFVGRLGALTIASALALRRARNRVRYPEGQVVIG